MTTTITGAAGINRVADGADMPAGSVVQIVNGTTTTEAASTINGWVDTGLAIAITPTSTSSKILVIVSQPADGHRGDNEADVLVKIQSNHSGSYADLHTVVDDQRYMNTYQSGVFSSTRTTQIFNFNVLFSPSSTSSFTVKTQMRFRSNYGTDGDVTTQQGGHSSSITLMEIAG